MPSWTSKIRNSLLTPTNNQAIKGPIKRIAYRNSVFKAHPTAPSAPFFDGISAHANHVGELLGANTLIYQTAPKATTNRFFTVFRQFLSPPNYSESTVFVLFISSYSCFEPCQYFSTVFLYFSTLSVYNHARRYRK